MAAEAFYPRATVLWRRPYVELVHDASTGIFATRWLGFAPSAEYRATLEEAVVLASQLAPTAWLADNRAMRVVGPRDQTWTVERWWPTFARLPIRRLAIVLATDMFNRLAIERIVQRATVASPWETAHYDRFEPALAWAEAASR